MQYVTLPNTDLRVSQIALGTGNLGSGITRDDSFALLDAFVEAGGTFIDTAHVYGDWVPGEKSRSEKVIGEWLRHAGRKAGLVIATKGGHEDLDAPDIPRVTPELILSDLEGSLACLGLDAIDLYWLHRDDRTQPVGPLIDTLNEQVRAGTIRYFGCSNWEPDRIAEADRYAAQHDLQTFVASQILWTLAVPNPGAVTPVHAIMNDDALAFYKKQGMSVVAFTPQARGFFAKAQVAGVSGLKDDLRRAFENAETVARLERVQKVAQQLGTSVTAVVRAFISSQPLVAVPVIGPTSLDQLEDSLFDPDLTLTPATLHYLVSGEEYASHAL